MKSAITAVLLAIVVVLGSLPAGAVGAVGAVDGGSGVEAVGAVDDGSVVEESGTDDTDISAAREAVRSSPTEVESYVIQQGDRCHELVPLSSDGTVEEFYDYRNHVTHPDAPDEDRQYSSYGTTHLQESDTSILFLHEGADGLSLVIVHDELDGGTDGGSATFEIAGLPADGEWVIEDDNYPSAEDDTFDHGDGWSEITWVWGIDRTDGAAFNGGLDEPFSIAIDPAFNEEANYRWTDDGHDGDITEWNALSGETANPDRIDLSLDEPIVIRSGTCAGPTVRHERIDRGLAASISSTGDEPAFVRSPTGPSPDLDFRHLAVESAGNPLAVALETPPENEADAALEEVTGAEAISSIEIDGDAAAVEGAELTFRVAMSHLEATGVDPDTVGLYEDVDGEWVLAPTERVGAVDEGSSEYVTYRATLSRATTAVVATQHPEIELVDVSIDRERITAGERVELTATVRNTGQAAGTYPVELEAFGEVVDRERVAVEPNEEVTMTLEQRIDAPGTHELLVNQESVSVTVEADGTPDPAETVDPSPIDVRSEVGIATVGAVLAVAIVLTRRILN